jgi:hypothetical protein
LDDWICVGDDPKAKGAAESIFNCTARLIFFCTGTARRKQAQTGVALWPCLTRRHKTILREPKWI